MPLLSKKYMSRVCQITGSKTSPGHTRSHAMNATNRKYKPNLFIKKVFDPKSGKMVKIKVSAAGLRTMSKNPL